MGQRQPIRQIGDVVERERLTRKIEDVREADFRLGANPVLSHDCVEPIRSTHVRIMQPARSNSGDHRVVDTAGSDPPVDWAASRRSHWPGLDDCVRDDNARCTGLHVPKVPFAKLSDAIQTFLFDGPDEALSMA